MQLHMPSRMFDDLFKAEMEDISHELPDAFLMVGQYMRAKVLWKGKKYLVTGWRITTPYVVLIPEEEKNGKRNNRARIRRDVA